MKNELDILILNSDVTTARTSWPRSEALEYFYDYCVLQIQV